MAEKILSSSNICTLEDLAKVLNCTIEEINAVEQKPFRTAKIKIKGKFREISVQKDNAKIVNSNLNYYIQTSFDCPNYNQAGWKGKNCITNARVHAGQRWIKMLDIKNYYISIKKYKVKEFLEKTLNLHGEALNFVLKITTHNGHLAQGGSASQILAFLINQQVFDCIHKTMNKNGIKMTVYVDDICLSSSEMYLGKWVEKYVAKVLQTNSLKLNYKKIKLFGYKGAIITGIKTTQEGKLIMPFRVGHSIIKDLQAKSIEKMSQNELRKTLGKITYYQQLHPDKFKVTKRNIQRRLKAIQQKKGKRKC